MQICFVVEADSVQDQDRSGFLVAQIGWFFLEVSEMGLKNQNY